MRILLVLLVLYPLSAAMAAEPSPYRLYKTSVIGEDSRNKSDAFPKSPDSNKYRAVGHISCDDPNDPTMYISSGTATLVENQQTIITAAHTFFKPDGTLLANLDKCAFYTVDDNGKDLTKTPLLDLMAVENAASDNIGGKSSTTQNDWAVIKLKLPVQNVLPFKVARTPALNINDKIKLCSFSHDIEPQNVKRCLSGTYKNNGADAATTGNPYVLYHDIDTNGSSSGAPLFTDGATPVVHAIHVRGKCEKGYTNYDREKCRNVGIFFNSEFYKNLDLIVEETGGSIYGPAKVQKTKFITPVPANPNREVST